MLLWNTIGAMSIVGWNFGVTLIVCFLLKRLNWLRVKAEDEVQGLDYSKHHHEPAYTGGCTFRKNALSLIPSQSHKRITLMQN
jgi:ammonia channel protein AmtB